jgi:DNA helicase-2/ATP-dependent DNA helicase PcrA
MSGYLERVSLIAAPDTMQDAQLVNLMTVHGAKGLEFGVVFLTGMEETIFPYKGVDQSHGESDEELDEERRLAYVAITRAKKRLVITHCSTRQLFGRTHYLSSSRFLADIPASVVSKEGSVQSAPAPAFRRYGSEYGGGYGGNSYGRGSQPAAKKPSLAPGTRIVERDAESHFEHDGVEITVRPGTRVRHKQFGDGVVESIEPGESPIVVARFNRVGKKRIKSEFLEFD